MQSIYIIELVLSITLHKQRIIEAAVLDQI